MKNRANSIAHGGGLCLRRPTKIRCLPYKSAHLAKEPPVSRMVSIGIPTALPRLRFPLALPNAYRETNANTASASLSA
jgi:hypothetical protein